MRPEEEIRARIDKNSKRIAYLDLKLRAEVDEFHGTLAYLTEKYLLVDENELLGWVLDTYDKTKCLAA